MLPDGTTWYTWSHYSADACFAGLWGGRLSEEWAPWWAKPTKDWKDWKTLAEGLEPVIVDRLRIPKELLAPYHPMPGVRPAEPGKWGYTRLLVEWRKHWGRILSFETGLSLRPNVVMPTSASRTPPAIISNIDSKELGV